jgi:hypothetical protein
MLLELLVNQNSLTVTTKQFEGADYWVVPVTMLKEGVYPGSQGPLFYPAKANKASARAWNNMPIVVNHPQDAGGNYISARTPAVLQQRGIGMVLDAKAPEEGKKLVANAWFRKDRTTAIMPELAVRLTQAEAGETVKPINVSTGLFPTFVANAGTHEGRSYTSEVGTMEPDHLAILLDQPGACTVTDGCGVLVANESFDEIREACRTAMRSNIGDGTYLVDVYPDNFVFEVGAGKLYRQAYTMASGVAKLSGTYTPVIRSVTYSPLIVANEGTMSNTNCTCGAGAAPAAPAPAPVANAAATPAPTTTPAATPAAPPVVNMLDGLPPEQQVRLQDALALAGRVRSALVANIKANPANQFSDAELGSLPSDHLEKLVALGAPVANAAAAPAPGTMASLLQLAYQPQPAPVANAQPVDNRARGAAPVTNAATPARTPLAAPSTYTPPTA